MAVHFLHDLGQEQLISPFAPATAVCGSVLREAHEVVRPDSDVDVCADCLSWSRRNKYQNFRCAVEMSAAEPRPGPAEKEAAG
jgi:ribosome-binding protein aMBF1 (putative translation factor)